jgi:hypothetical protein
MAKVDTAAQPPEIFMARRTFVVTLDGVPVTVRAGDTVRAGHPLLKKRGELFAPFAPKFDHIRDHEAQAISKAAADAAKAETEATAGEAASEGGLTLKTAGAAIPARKG